jgi:HNH endonuclease
MRRSLTERFWEKVRRGGLDDCWEWTRGRFTRGYGSIGVGGRAGGSEGAHRVSWELAHGPIPEGLYVLHKCDNPPCVNPAHLFLGTQLDNMRDAARKGRTARGGRARGERIGASKLTEAKVTEIRRRYRAGEETQAELGRVFGVHQASISDIVRGETWRHAA